MMNYFFNNVELFGSTDEEYEHPIGRYWFYFSVAFSNPVNLLVVRMQSVDFEHRRLHRAAWDMIKNDRISMFYRGLFPVFMA